MFKSLLVLTFIGLVAAGVVPDEDWNYVNVRANANMFWWLYGKTDQTTRDNAPLVIWLQGGPGGSSTGFGNFLEIGPLQYMANGSVLPREYAWTNSANILFIDNPVGTGFSYVTDDSAYTTNEDMIAGDLVVCMQAFFKQYPVFQTNPLFIFSESYGGKMASSFAKALKQAITNGQIQANFKAVALGDSWIKPISFVNNWGPYLLWTSETDEVGYNQIVASAKACDAAVKQQSWLNATNLWNDCENVVETVTANVNFYNILDRNPNDNSEFSSKKGQMTLEERIKYRLSKYYDVDITAYMNGPIRQKLADIPANVSWGAQAGDVFSYLSVDFMQSVVPTVDWLLANGVTVYVYSGNLDLICTSQGTLQWMKDLKWPYLKNWQQAPYNPVTVNNEVVSFTKYFQNLRYVEILTAGHMVPADQPVTAINFLNNVLAGN